MSLTVSDLDDLLAGPTGETSADAPPGRVILCTDDGYLYDAESGEVVGYRGDRSGWRPDSPDDVEWALAVRAEIEADLARARLRTEAATANLKAIERTHERRLAGWDWRFRPDVIAYARKALEGGKSKTLQFENGKVAFRTSPGTAKITDLPAAVDFVAAHRPEAVKVERSVGVKAVLEAAAALGYEAKELDGFLFRTGPKETAVVDSGIGKAAKGK